MKRAVPRTRLSHASALLLYRHMDESYRAGLPLTEALQALALGDHGDPVLAGAARLLATDVAAGRPLSEAARRHSRLFDPLDAAILAAGEAGGAMDESLSQLAQAAQTRHERERQLRQSLRYPIIAGTLTLAACGFLLLVVVPQVETFLVGLGGTLPWATRLLLQVTQAAQTILPILLTLTMFLALGWKLAPRLWPSLAMERDGWALRVPGLGIVLHRMAWARVAQALALLLRSGFGVTQALDLARATAGNRAVAARLAVAGEDVRHGAPLSLALSRVRGAPALLVTLVRSGEQSGRLPPMLTQAARLQEQDAQHRTQQLIGMIEPSMVLVLGGLLAWVVAAVWGPLYGQMAMMGGGM
ncbi:MAG: type II secretion system F family protein [Alphaproteobacteria bacterium]|nr:MAG: type II secretion system F family protein [Alphaproteobacteria bacterium]